MRPSLFASHYWIGSSLLAPFALAKDQIARPAARALRFGLVACLGKVRPRQPPIVCALRGPGEIARPAQMLERPGYIVRDVAGETELAARPQDARALCNAAVLDQPPLPIPA